MFHNKLEVQCFKSSLLIEKQVEWLPLSVKVIENISEKQM